jgi:hypothetical protein
MVVIWEWVHICTDLDSEQVVAFGTHNTSMRVKYVILVTSQFVMCEWIHICSDIEYTNCCI